MPIQLSQECVVPLGWTDPNKVHITQHGFYKVWSNQEISGFQIPNCVSGCLEACVSSDFHRFPSLTAPEYAIWTQDPTAMMVFILRALEHTGGRASSKVPDDFVKEMLVP